MAIYITETTRFYVYQTTCLVNGKIYIGIHMSDDIENDSYLGSGVALKNAIEKYGWWSFKREILFTFNTLEEASNKEAELVNEEFLAREDVYNIMLGGKSSYTNESLTRGVEAAPRKQTEESKRKLSETRRRPENSARTSRQVKERFASKEAREELARRIRKAYEDNPELRDIQRANAKQRIKDNPDAHQRFLDARHSEETRTKRLESWRKYYETHDHHHKGRHLSDREKDLKRNAMTGTKTYTNGKGKNIQIKPENGIPKGFYPGRSFIMEKDGEIVTTGNVDIVQWINAGWKRIR